MKVLIVDDEIEACKNIDFFLQKNFKTNLIETAFATTLSQANLVIQYEKPNLVFFDISLGNENSVEFLLEQQSIRNYEIIFVTAYSEFAHKAFRINALDYLLKPINENEFNLAVERAILKINKELKSDNALGLKQLKNQIIDNSYEPQKMILRENDFYHSFYFTQLLFIESINGYSCFHYENTQNIEKTITSSYHIAYYEETLPKHIFFRIHKSYIINCQKILTIKKETKLEVILKNQKVLPISRRKANVFFNYLKIN